MFSIRRMDETRPQTVTSGGRRQMDRWKWDGGASTDDATADNILQSVAFTHLLQTITRALDRLCLFKVRFCSQHIIVFSFH